MSNPSLQAVRSAARAQPLAPEGAKKVTKERLKEGAIDTILNTFGILRDIIDDFKSANRFFKYKAMVLGAWLLLSSSSFLIACPGGAGPSNDIGAQLVVTQSDTKRIYMVTNESAEPWQGVEVIVNGNWRSTMAQVEPNGEVGLNILFDANGKRAPSDLVITDIQLRVTEPEEDFVLLKGGEPQ